MTPDAEHPEGSEPSIDRDAADALGGLTVIDVSTLFAGPLAATMLGDFGAEVIKVEHPAGGDPARGHGHAKNGVGLWWKLLGRNKRCVTLYLGDPEGAELFLSLAREADVVIENFRPGTLERWGLGPDQLHEINPRLVLARVTAFGQVGPLSSRPGFGTQAESMSGFAQITGQPDGPPTLPPFGLADGVTALTTAFAVMAALRARERTGAGQVVDLAIIEPLLTILGAQPIVYDQLGIIQQRTGNRSANNAPRNTYRSADGRWLAVSTSAQKVAERVVRLVGRADLVEQPWFATGGQRAEHADELDAAVGNWIAQRSASEVIEAFEQANAAIAPIYDIADIMGDPQYQALESITTVEDAELGPIKMQNVLFRMPGAPGRIRWPGPSLGAHNQEVYGRLGLSSEQLAGLRQRGIV